jgi:mono/diheme cytochrome c family protein
VGPFSLIGLLIVLMLATKSAHGADLVDYVRDVKPLLAERCFACHGTLKQNGKLRLDSGDLILKSEVVVPGKPEHSSLLNRVMATDEHERMPPEGLPLTPAQVATLRAWIEQGAKFPSDDAPEPDPREHWAFRPPVRPTIPDGEGNPIDRFIAVEWAKRGLKPVAESDPRLLVRRMYLDLIGLPPTPAQTDNFLSRYRQNQQIAVDQLADELLASPHYGERWGRHFLDIWRYSDWWGLGAEVRNSQKHMWHWRDWVIESLNADMSYAEMVRLMLAADELAPTDLAQVRATGYLARQYFLFNRNTWLDETVEHTAKAFLGLTWNCARCHDHKYDPISQTDYFRLRAIFEPYQVRTDLVPGELDVAKDGIPRAFDCNLEAPTYRFVRGDEKQPVTDQPIPPGLPGFLAANGIEITPVNLPSEAHAPQLRPHVKEAYLAAARTEGEAAVRAVEARWEAERLKVFGPPEKFKEAARWAAVAEKYAAVVQAEQELAKAAGVRRIGPALKLAAAKKAAVNPGEEYTPIRGAIKTPESNIESAESQNKPFPTTSTGRRTALANWIADPRNPLTARVAVNHVWLRHVGSPLVATVFDFGRKGATPTHAELLDWLAVEFVESGWSLKHLHRLIVTSQVYRLSSSNAGAGLQTREADPENRYLWRMNSVRMDAPTIRDSLLHLAGDLDLTLGGPAVPPAQQETSRRRSVYFFQSHNEHSKFLSIFDDANVLECYRRTESIVPQQALALANSKFAMTAGEKIAATLGDRPDPEFIRAAFELLLGSTPSADEQAACEAAMAKLRALAKDRPAAEQAKRARVNLVQALLNHNDFVTVR